MKRARSILAFAAATLVASTCLARAEASLDLLQLSAFCQFAPRSIFMIADAAAVRWRPATP
jgi:hypothetical protein